MSEKHKPPCRQKLWKKEKPPYEVGYHGFTWLDVKYFYDNWADAEMFHPLKFALVYLQTKNRVKPGWWNGHKWVGYWLKPNEKVLHWKKCIHFDS